MHRRSFLAGLVTIAAPLAAEAQPAGKVYRVGYLGVVPRPPDDAFRAGIRELGYIDGQNILLEYRWGGASAVPGYVLLVKELLALKVDVIVALSSLATAAVKEAAPDTPAIFVDVGDPIAYGFVSNLRRPGGKMTGLSAALTDTAPKALQLLKEVVPSLTQVRDLGQSEQSWAHGDGASP